MPIAPVGKPHSISFSLKTELKSMIMMSYFAHISVRTGADPINMDSF
jgi:hypothetical protein